MPHKRLVSEDRRLRDTPDRGDSSAPAEIRVMATLGDLVGIGADLFLLYAQEAICRHGRFTVALSGGSTPRHLYRRLAKADQVRSIWDKMHLFWGDERHVPPDHPDSNYRMACEELRLNGTVPAAQVHRIPAEDPDPWRAALSYERSLLEFFHLGAGQWPRFDLVLLGLGADGHLASLFPESPALREYERLAIADWRADRAAYRITLTAPVFNAAASILFLVSGTEKAQVLQKTLEGAYHPEGCPAQLIRPARGRVLWLVDAGAASLLHQRSQL